MSMKFLTLPSGAQMPTIGLGTWQAGSTEIEAALESAFDAGYRHIDTAWVYKNEESIGDVLRKWFSSNKVKREELFITTKLPMAGVHPDRVDYFLNNSLKKLKLDYVDLYLVHFPVGLKFKLGERSKKLEFEAGTHHAAIWRKMEEQVDRGRAKNVGLSNYNIFQIETVLKSARIKPACLQVELHVYLQQPELVDFCHINGISVSAYSPLGSPSFNNFLHEMGQQKRIYQNVLEDPYIAELAKKHLKTPAQIALRFLIQRGVAVLPKSVTPKRIQENMDILHFSLGEGEMEKLQVLNVGEKARICDFRFVNGVEHHPDFPFK